MQSFLRGETQIPKDEAFKECIESYLHVFLKSERVAQIVGGGALSQHDCREVFRYENVDKFPVKNRKRKLFLTRPSAAQVHSAGIFFNFSLT